MNLSELFEQAPWPEHDKYFDPGGKALLYRDVVEWVKLARSVQDAGIQAAQAHREYWAEGEDWQLMSEVAMKRWRRLPEAAQLCLRHLRRDEHVMLPPFEALRRCNPLPSGW